MRIRLEKGKQKELILLAKNDNTWKELSKKVNLNENYLANDLKSERRLISENIYNKFCELCQLNFDQFIIKRLNDNWGKSKGGLNSRGSTIKIKIPKPNESLAEIVGAILGDGHIMYHKKEKKIGVYQVNITGDINKDKNYHTIYLRKLFKDLFNIKTREIISSRNDGRHLVVYSKELVNFFINMGLKAGDKIKNQTTIPKWIWQNNKYLRACIRGLIDTDGCIHKMSKKDPQLLRINFTNYNQTLLEDTRIAFIKLGFFPSKIICYKQFFISRKDNISKYLKEIGFSNKKHQDRLNQFIAL